MTERETNFFAHLNSILKKMLNFVYHMFISEMNLKKNDSHGFAKRKLNQQTLTDRLTNVMIIDKKFPQI